MNIYKMIFRFDYPLNYSILDRLGSSLDFIKKNSELKPFEDVSHNIDLIRHRLTSSGKYDENIFNLTLSVNTFDGYIDFKNGLSISNLTKFNFINFVDSILNKIEISDGVYNRIGFRILIIDGSEPLKFQKVLDYLIKKNENFGNAFSSYFKDVNDTSITLESINEDTESLRVILGPYKKTEAIKFFLFEPDVEGLMIDMDLFQSKLKLPQFSLSNYIKKNHTVFSKLSSEVIDKIKKELKEK